MMSKIAISAALASLAGLIAFSGGFPGLARPELIGVALAVGLFAALIDEYRTRVLIEEAARQTVEYMGVQKPITVSYGMGTQLVQQALFGLQRQITKAMGKSLLAFERAVEAGVRGAGAAAAVLVLIGLPAYVSIGLWIILATAWTAVLLRASGLFQFIFGLLSASVAPFSAYTDRAKRLIAVVAVAGIASWLLYAAMWWAMAAAFGSQVGLAEVFMVYALVSLAVFGPFSLEGAGWTELVGVLLLPSIGVQVGAAFCAVALWDLCRLTGRMTPLFISKRGEDLAKLR